MGVKIMTYIIGKRRPGVGVLRDYYVTMRRDNRTAWLAGPFATHAAALAMVDNARSIACQIDPWSDFDAFGTSSLARGTGVVGKINSQLGLRQCPGFPHVMASCDCSKLSVDSQHACE